MSVGSLRVPELLAEFSPSAYTTDTPLSRFTYDVIIDLRPNSLTYKQWLGTELTAENYKMLYVPESFAHGFQTLENDTEVIYQVSQFYAPQSERGVRYNDPAFGIKWPVDVQVITDKDNNWADYAA